MPDGMNITKIELVKAEAERPNRIFHVEVSGPDWTVELLLPERLAVKFHALLGALDLNPPKQDDLKRMS